MFIKNGASHTELILSENSIVVTEVGARMGGDFIGSHLIELSTGYNYLNGVLDIALGKFKPPEILFNKFSGVYFLSEKSQHIASYINRKNEYSEIIEAALTGTEPKSLTSSRDRNGYLIYQSDVKFVI